MTLTASEGRTWVPLSHRERRVAGVLVEKQKTTPEYYPMSVAAIVTGCNQKSNRDPVTNFDADDVEEILIELRKKGAAVMIEGSGRVVKWKHTLYDWIGLRNKPVEMAVMAELLLRGKQTEGDLRARAARMEPIPDLDALQGILNTLKDMDLVVYLTTPGQRRGAVVTHNLYPPNELVRVREEFARSAPLMDDAPPPARSEASTPSRPATDAAVTAELAELREQVQSLKLQVETIASALRDLQSSLGV